MTPFPFAMIGAAACGLLIGWHALPPIESTYELTATTPAGHVYVLDYDMSRDDCTAELAAIPRELAGFACVAVPRHSTF